MYKVKKGSIIIYRVFDIGDEINLHSVKVQNSLFIKDNWTLNKQNSKPSIIVKNPPVSIQIKEEKIRLGEVTFNAQTTLKIWDYGVCSVSFNLPISDISFSDLIKLQADIEADQSIDKLAKNKVEEMFKNISQFIKDAHIWDIFEDYTLICAEEVVSDVLDPNNLNLTPTEVKLENPRQLLNSTMAHLLLGEKKEVLSEMMISETLETHLQYSKKDLTIIDWNSGFVLDPLANSDIPELIEFVLTHQLEIRYYNQLLETKKKILYDNAGQNMQTNMLKLNNLFSDISVQASQRFLEFSEILRKIDNSLETVGDIYLAKIIDAADKKFNRKIRKQLDKNMMELKDQAESFSSQIKSWQSNMLSVCITVLIVIELLIPLISWMTK